MGGEEGERGEERGERQTHVWGEFCEREEEGPSTSCGRERRKEEEKKKK